MKFDSAGHSIELAEPVNWFGKEGNCFKCAAEETVPGGFQMRLNILGLSRLATLDMRHLFTMLLTLAPAECAPSSQNPF